MNEHTKKKIINQQKLFDEKKAATTTKTNLFKTAKEWKEIVFLMISYSVSPTEPLVAFDALQEVQIPVVGQNQCRCSSREYEDILTDEMVCAGRDNKGACQVKKKINPLL